MRFICHAHFFLCFSSDVIQFIHLSGYTLLIFLNRVDARIGRDSGSHIRFVKPPFVRHELALCITTALNLYDQSPRDIGDRVLLTEAKKAPFDLMLVSLVRGT
jgi:hypothetical protein